MVERVWKVWQVWQTEGVDHARQMRRRQHAGGEEQGERAWR